MQLHTWVYVLGYLLAFGTILAKMWRVYQIFHNPTPNKMVHYTSIEYVQTTVSCIDLQIYRAHPKYDL